MGGLGEPCCHAVTAMSDVPATPLHPRLPLGLQGCWLIPESQEGFGLVALMSDGVGSGELSLGLGSLQWEGREEKRPQPLMEEERLGLEQA